MGAPFALHQPFPLSAFHDAYPHSVHRIVLPTWLAGHNAKLLITLPRETENIGCGIW